MSGYYKFKRKPEHPRANGAGQVFEHHLVMEQKLGRHLEPGEIVHHHDGDTRNNDPDNLVLFASIADHGRFHARERVRQVYEELCNTTPKEWGEIWLDSEGLKSQYDKVFRARGYSAGAIWRGKKIITNARGRFFGNESSITLEKLQATKEQFIGFALLRARRIYGLGRKEP